MWGCGVWEPLQVILDAAEDAGVLVHALDAHSARCGGLHNLATFGASILQNAVESLLSQRRLGCVHDLGVDEYGRARRWHWTSTYGEEAWNLVRSERLARVFDALGLDCRLHRHPHQLKSNEKAEIIRAIVGEVHRDHARAPDPGRSAALNMGGLPPGHQPLRFLAIANELAKAVCELRPAAALPACSHAGNEPYVNNLSGKKVRLKQDSLRPRSVGLPQRRIAPCRPRVDTKLQALLRNGNARAIAERIKTLYTDRELNAQAELRQTLMEVLPDLSDMRRLVFVAVLHWLAHDIDGVRSVSSASGLVSSLERAALRAGYRLPPTLDFSATESRDAYTPEAWAEQVWKREAWERDVVIRDDWERGYSWAPPAYHASDIGTLDPFDNRDAYYNAEDTAASIASAAAQFRRMAAAVPRPRSATCN